MLTRIKRKIAIFGATGNIGIQTINVVSHLDSFVITAITGHNQHSKLIEQCRQLKPQYVALEKEACIESIQMLTAATETLYYGKNALADLARLANYDIAVFATVGIYGLGALIEAIKRGKRICLANKESLVVAGDILLPLAKQYGAELIPIDTEHSAMFQCLQGEPVESISKIILTCSGGPFLNVDEDKMNVATVQQSLKHPTWNMGPTISIESATLINKGFEVIEAHHLFDMPYQKIEVIIHPESIVHSCIEFVDGNIKAVLSKADVGIAIQYALTYPDRAAFPNHFKQFNAIGTLSFIKPNVKKFPLLALAYQVGKRGGLHPTVLNAANEVAVNAYLAGYISFGMMARVIKKTINLFRLTIDDLPVNESSIVSLDASVKAATTKLLDEIRI